MLPRTAGYRGGCIRPRRSGSQVSRSLMFGRMDGAHPDRVLGVQDPSSVGTKLVSELPEEWRENPLLAQIIKRGRDFE